MLKVALRGLVAHKGRLLATLLAVALGVAFIGGVLVLTDTMNKSFDDLFSGVYEGTDAVVRSSETIDSGFGGEGEQRGDVDAGLLATVRAVGSVRAAEGEVQGYAQVIGRDGDALGAGGFGPPTFGGNWQEVKQLNSWTLRSGEGPGRDDEIVLDAASAKSADYAVGDEVPVQTKKGLGRFRLSGIAGFGTSDSPAGASYVLFTTGEAQQQVGQPGKFSSIGVVARPGVSQAEVVRDLRKVVGQGVEVLTGKQITEESQSDLKDQLSFFTIALLAFGVVAVLVGAFVIYNSFSIVVAQRTREMVLLRAIGASRRQVRRAVVVEALAVGLVGSVVGFLLGLGIASLLTGLMDIEGPLVVRPRPLLIAIAMGMAVTLVAALVPARRASSVPPVAALREVAIDTSARSHRRLVVGLGLLAMAVVIALLGIANTIALSVLERTRELGLLRAVGMTRRQLRATIRWESVIIALFGAALGLLLGVLGAWGMIEALRDDGFEVFRLPVPTLVIVAVVAGGLGMAAAVVPAWRAGRLQVLDAIRTE